MYMYILCFNVSICFKMGYLYSNCDIITKLVYPPELQDFVLILLKFFRGRTPTPPFKQRYLKLYYNHDTANNLNKLKTHKHPLPPPPIILANSRSIGLFMFYLKSPLFSRTDAWKNKEKSLKPPWKCTSKLLEKSLKKVCHDLLEPWLQVLLFLARSA